MPRQANTDTGQSISGRSRNGSVPEYLGGEEQSAVRFFLRIRLAQRERSLVEFRGQYGKAPKEWRDPMIASMTYAIAEIKRLMSTVVHPVGYMDVKTGERREP